MSSREEGLGITVIEAMAAGLPVVATAAGGIPELIQDNVTGHLVPPGDPRRLADCLLEVLADSARGRQMGDEGRKRAAEQFGLSRMITAYEQLYTELAGS
jgi:glycosyltransferase involved in cell wall biosynthesis